jgi:hypothetical protein
MLKKVMILAGVIGSGLIALASIAPEVAFSNLAEWVKLALDNAPSWLTAEGLEEWVMWVGVALLAFALLCFAFPRIYSNVNSKQLNQKGDSHGELLDAWGRVPRLELFQAACLWAGEEPKLPLREGQQYAHLRMLKAAVEDRRLVPFGTLDEVLDFRAGRRKPNVHTVVSREALRELAASQGQRPAFLFPEDRGGTADSQQGSISETVSIIRQLYARGVALRNQISSLRVLDEEHRAQMREVSENLRANVRILVPVQSINLDTINIYNKQDHPMLHALGDDEAYIFSELLARVRKIVESYPG